MIIRRNFLSAILFILVPYKCYCEDYNLLLCEGQEKDLACSDDATINVISATYGYNASNEEAREKCEDFRNIYSPFLDTDNTNCYHPHTTDIVADKCNGLSQCTISATNEIFADPCRGVTKYLELYYNCTKDEDENELPTATYNMSGEEQGDGNLGEGRGGRDWESYSSKSNSESPDDTVLMTTGLPPVSVVFMVAVSAGVLVAFIAMILSVGLVLCLRKERSCIYTKCKKSDREEFKSKNSRGKHNTGSLDMEYEVVGNNENTPNTDSNQSPHYETSIHVTNANFEYDYAVETRPVRFDEPQARYLNIK